MAHFKLACGFKTSLVASLVTQTVKVSAYNAGDPGSIPGLGRCRGEGNGSPLQYSCLGSPMDRGAWQATVHGVAKELDPMTKQQARRQPAMTSFFIWGN